MKTHRLALTLSFLCCSFIALSQCDRMIADADAAAKSRDYEDAINKYNAALLCDPSKKAQIDRKLYAVFSEIEKQRDDAVKAKNQLDAANRKIAAERDRAQKAEQEALAQARKANRAAMANHNAALALQTTRHNPALAIRLAEYNKRLFPDELVSNTNFYQLLGDTSLCFYQQMMSVTEKVQAIAASPDGKWIAAGLAKGYVVLQPTDQNPGAATHTWPASPRDIFTLDFSPDSRYLLCAGASRIPVIWEISDSVRFFRELPKHNTAIRSARFHPDGQHIATATEQDSGNDGLVRLWSLADSSNAPKTVFKGYSSTVRCLAISPDGKIVVAGGYDNSLMVWDFERPEKIKHHLLGHQADVLSCAFTPDNRYLASGCETGDIFLWDMENPEAPFREIAAHADAVTSLGFSSDGTFLLSGSADRSAKLWSPLKRMDPVQVYKGHTDKIQAVTFATGTNLCWTGGSDKSLRLWSVEARPMPVRETANGNFIVTELHLSPDGQLAWYSGTDGMVRSRDLARESEGRSFKAHDMGIETMALSADGRWMATADFNGAVHIWDLAAEPERKGTLQCPDRVRPLCLLFSNDRNALLYGGSDSAFYIQNLKQLSIRPLKITGHVGQVTTLRFDKSGQRLASGSDDNTVKLWAWKDGKPELLQTFTGHSSNISALQFGPGDSTLFSGSLDRSVRIWPLNNPAAGPTVLLPGEYGNSTNITAISLIDDQAVLAVATYDGNLRIWQTDFDNEPYWKYPKMLKEREYINTLAADKTRNLLLAGTSQGRLIIQPTPEWYLREKVAPAPLIKLLEAGLQIDLDSLEKLADETTLKAVLAQTRHKRGNFAEAVRLWQALLRDHPSPEHYIGWYEAEKAMGRDVGDQLLALDSVAYLRAFAEYFNKKSDWTLAKKSAQRWAAQQEHYLPLAYLYEACLRSNTLDDTLIDRIADRKTMENVGYMLSVAVDMPGNDEKILVRRDMVRILRRMMEYTPNLDPQHAATNSINVSHAYMSRGEYEKALEWLNIGIAFDSTCIHLYKLMPNLLIYLERYDEARTIVEKWKDKNCDPSVGVPKFRDAFSLAFEQLERQGRLTATQRRELDKLRTALKGNP